MLGYVSRRVAKENTAMPVKHSQKNENIQVFWEEWRHAAFVLKKRSVSNNLSASSAVDVNRTVLFESNSVRSVIAST